MLYEQNQKEKKYFTPAEVLNQDADNDRLILIRHKKNGGVGAAIATGYKWCKDRTIDCVAVMAGDGQMDPDELESICTPVVTEGIDFVKDNRLTAPPGWPFPEYDFLETPYCRYLPSSPPVIGM